MYVKETAVKGNQTLTLKVKYCNETLTNKHMQVTKAKLETVRCNSASWWMSRREKCWLEVFVSF